MTKVLDFFLKISQIPRCSGNEKAVADFLIDFAKKRNLYYFKDDFNNVFIKKHSSNKPFIILQSHTDMVGVKEKNFSFDFSKQPIKVIKEENYLKSYKTSLGADNGIGVALILTLLDEKNDYNIEALFTSREELDMKGSINFDYSKLSSKKMISLDGLCENELINGCASICDMFVKTNFKKEKCQKKGFMLSISGLKGGHSGEDIDKNENVFYVALKFFKSLKNLRLSSLSGGEQFNFIPSSCSAKFCCNHSFQKLKKIISKTKESYKDFKDLKLYIKEVKVKSIFDEFQTNKLLFFLTKLEQGVLKNINNKIILSQNLASINTNRNIIKISQRGHNNKLEDQNILRLKSLAERNNFKLEIFDRQPGFESKKTMDLTTQISKIYNELFGKTLKVLSKHISLEAAIFIQKIKDLDVVIISPTILDAHSIYERVFIPSVFRTYQVLKKIFETT